MHKSNKHNINHISNALLEKSYMTSLIRETKIHAEEISTIYSMERKPINYILMGLIDLNVEQMHDYKYDLSRTVN